MTSPKIPADCIVFDTETTGFSAEEGDRLVEIGAVRMRGGLPTRETFHCYINPARTVPKDAVDVHGLTTEFLADKPMFEEIAADFISFVGDLPMVAHNAKFDEKFINFELAQIGKETFPKGRFVDTLPIAKKMFPGQQVNLDALCRKMKISLDSRDKHGALIDSELLAEVCVELMGGRQANLFGELGPKQDRTVETVAAEPIETYVRYASPEERAAHNELVGGLGEGALWNLYKEDAA